MRKKVILSFFVLSFFVLQGQTIEMNFPALAGQKFRLVLFQGSEEVEVQKGVVANDGTFALKIPQKYAPYKGIVRWMLGDSKSEGLHMAIPGKGYQVSCLSKTPKLEDIIYKGYDPVNELNRLFGVQQKILAKYELMSNAMQVYKPNNKLYSVFAKEQKSLVQIYEKFQQDLKKNTNYNARILPFINLAKGIPRKLLSDKRKRALLGADYYANELNFDELYTSGHWANVLSNWVVLHTQILPKDSLILPHFIKMGKRISDPKKYTDFVERITHYLSYYGKDEYVSLLAPAVFRSGKITSYEGKLSVYRKVLIGMQAPALFTDIETKGSKKKRNKLPSAKFAQNGAEATLLLFYESDCGHCEELLARLLKNYLYLKEKGYDIIAVSSDIDKKVFDKMAKTFPWKRTYCDLEGLLGSNFVNYAVFGTPTVFVIDKEGKIVTQMATIQQVLDYVKTKK